MTTIAWDGSTLASDTQFTQGDGRKGKTTKIHVGRQWVFAGAGDLDACMRIGKWFREGAQERRKPKFHCDAAFEGMAFSKKGGRFLVALTENADGQYIPLLIEIEMPHWAIGSGGPYALTAMALGKSATDAISVAAEYDAFTGGEVHSVSVAK